MANPRMILCTILLFIIPIIISEETFLDLNVSENEKKDLGTKISSGKEKNDLNFEHAIYNRSTNIIEMTNLTIHETLKNNSIVLVLFYSLSCPHCKIFFPKYFNISEKISNITITQIDVEKYEDIGNEFNINFYPTLILYNKKYQYEYEGYFNETDIIEFLVDRSSPIYSIIHRVNVTESLIIKPFIIVYFGYIQEKEFFTLCDFLESRNRERFFVMEKPVYNFTENQMNSKLMIFKIFDEKAVSFNENFTYENLKSFFDKNLYPDIMNLNDDTLALLMKESKTGLVIFKDYNQSRYFNMTEYLKTLARKFKPEILFFLCESRANCNIQFGLDKGDAPRVEMITFSNKKLKRYLMKNDFNFDNIKQFITDYLNNKVERFYKSASIPKNMPGPVFKLVGKNYFEHVMNEKNDVMVKFFDPKCKHCKELAPIYADLARNLGKTEGVVIAELDITENEIPGLDISRIPTILFYSANDKHNPIQYSGEKDYIGLFEFLLEKCTKEHLKLLKEELMPDL